MDVRFWGTRGSIPTPLTPQQVRAKIEAAVQRITPRDLESPDSRERFVASLPPFLFGTVGGNTSCVEVRDSAGNLCLLDAGTGIREYAKHGVPAQDNTYHILLSHFHWDHLQGLPFFDYAYRGDCKIIFYSHFPAARRLLVEQMKKPYFPVQFDTSFHADISFHCIVIVHLNFPYFIIITIFGTVSPHIQLHFIADLVLIKSKLELMAILCFYRICITFDCYNLGIHCVVILYISYYCEQSYKD